MRSATATHVIIGGVMEHIEEAGIHSGDSACVIPPYSSAADHRRDQARRHRAIGLGARASRG